MGVTLQAGILAACVVFVPLGMAGMHLTRNRVLFFSSALFIVLAVSVHLLPYFPALSLSFYSLPAFRSVYGLFNANDPGSPAPLDCFSNLHEIEWQSPSLQSEMASLGPNKSEGTGSESDRDWNWNPKPLEECSFQRLESKEAVQLLQGTWIVVAGDSQARFFLVALLELLLPSAEPIRPQLFKRHSNYEYLWREEQMRLQFVWAPYSINLTRLARDFRRNQTYPDVFIMGAGLWHMLHATNASHYGESLVKLKKAVVSFFPSTSYSTAKSLEQTDSVSTQSMPHMFWLNLPTLIPSLFSSEVKRLRMTKELSHLYDQQLHHSMLLRPEGPLRLLDIQHLSHGCGPQCTQDGMHYSNATYSAALHVMINALLIASHQTPST